MKSALLTICLIILNVVAVTAQDHEFSFTEEFELTPPCKVSLATSDGFIKVHPVEGGTVKLFFIVYQGGRLQKMSRQEFEEEFEVRISKSDDQLDVDVQRHSGFDWFDRKNDFSLSLEALVPANTACHLKTSDGDIDLKGLTGMQKCRTSDGDIVIAGINGDLDAATSDGDLFAGEIAGDVHLVTSDGDIRAEKVDGNTTASTSDGDIRLNGVTGIMDLSTSDGDIEFMDCAGSVKGVTSDGDLRGSLIRLNDRLYLTTSDGSIDVTIPEGRGLDLKMRGEDVYLSGAEVNGRVEEDYIQGTVFGGGIPVDLFSSDGHVKLRFR